MPSRNQAFVATFAAVAIAYLWRLHPPRGYDDGIAVTSPTIRQPSSSSSSFDPRAFELGNETAYCDVSYVRRNDHRCLVPSYPGGSSAELVSVPREDARRFLREGSAFEMHPRYFRREKELMKYVMKGRTFNNIKQVYSAIVAARACGLMVLLPRKVDYRSASSSNVSSFSFFDCVDFRRAALPHPFPHYNPEDFCKIKSTVEEIHESVVAKGSRVYPKAVSRYWHEDRDYHLFPLPPVDYFDAARMEGKRALLAYWGMRPGSYRCRPCSVSRKESVVAYVRGEDVFRRGGVDHKGQPPLDFYVKAMRHANAKEVVVVSSDYMNPVVKALKAYDWMSEDGGNKSRVRVVERVGDPYDDALHLIFCASVLIMGSTSMGPTAMFSPNLQSVYMGHIKLMDNETIEDVESYRTKPLPITSWNVANENNVASILATVSNDFKAYAYVPMSEYTPYEVFKNTPQQRKEMISYKNGIIVRLN